MPKLYISLIITLCYLPLSSQNLGLLWAKQFASLSYTSGQYINTDQSGNVYTFGFFSDSTDFDPGSGVYKLAPNGNQADLFLSKLDAQGNFVWAKQFGGTNSERPLDFLIDDAGNLYLFGEFKGTADFDPGPAVFNLSTTVWECSYICKLDSQGNFLWAKQFSGPGANGILAAAIGPANNLYVTGTFKTTVDFDPGNGVSNLTSAGGRDVFNAKYDQNGNLLWVNRMGAGGDDQGIGIDVDDQGNVYSTGWFEGNVDFNPGSGYFPLLSQGVHDSYILKLDSAGSFLWAKSFGGSSYVNSIDLKLDGQAMYVPGVFLGTTDFDPGAGSLLKQSNGLADLFVSKLDTSGQLIWSQAVGGSQQDMLSAMEIDGFGGLILTGTFKDSVDFDPDSSLIDNRIIGTNNEDIFLWKLDSSGNHQWVETFGNTRDDNGHALAIDQQNRILLTGQFEGTVDFDPTTTSFTLSSANPNRYNHFTLSLSQCFTEIDTQFIRGCTPFLWEVNQQVYNTPGYYSITLPNQSSCDSIVTLAFSIDSNIIETALIQNGDTLWSAEPNATYQWLNCDSNYRPIPNANSAYFVATQTGNYACEIRKNSCVDTTLCYNMFVNSLEETLHSKIKVYPNPIKNEVRIQILPTSSISQIRIVNSAGQLIENTSIQSETLINTSNWEKGIYFIQIIDDRQFQSFKVIKL